MNNFYEIPRSRIIILFAAFVLFSLAISYRVFSFQVVQGFDLSEQAQSFRYRESVVPADRGDILDSRGRPLATNVAADRLSVIINQIEDPDETAQALAPIIDRDANEIYEAITQPDLEWVVLQRRLSDEASQQIEALNIEGLVLTPEPRRTYPMGTFAAHVLGFVNMEYEGSYGVEGAYDDLVGGEPGLLIGERDRDGNVIALGPSVWDSAEDGSDVVLTIDSAVQRIVEEALDEAIENQDAAGGTVIVQNPKTGAILGMASRPAYDPNAYNEADDVAVFDNPAVSGAYEPGSTLKAILMAIGLETDTVEPGTVHPGGLYRELPGGSRVYNATMMDFGPETMTEVLEHSSNVGVMWVADLLGEDDFYRGMVGFGFGETTGIDLPGESAGIFPMPGDPNWTPTNLYTNAFGQGMAVTPIQLTNAISVLANGGDLMEPYIVQEIRHPNGNVDTTRPEQVREVISEETSQTITEMLTTVMSSSYASFDIPGYDIAAKTGTAQIPSVEGGYEEGATIGSIVGYGPSDDPQFTVLVKIDRPQGSPWGERAAGPAFQRIFEELFLLRGIPPNNPDEASGQRVE